MTYYPNEIDDKDARQLLDSTLLDDDEQFALEQIIAAFVSDESCDNEAADILNHLRGDRMPPKKALAQARSLTVGEEITTRSACAIFVIRKNREGILWRQETTTHNTGFPHS